MRFSLSFCLCLPFAQCRRQSHCENATVYKSNQCGVDWEVQYEGTRYPVQNLSDSLKQNGNRIEIFTRHFYTDPRSCVCCGYTWLVIDDAVDELICL